jgi:hypothetical protein
VPPEPFCSGPFRYALAVDDFFGGALVGAGDGLAGGRAVGRGAVVVVGFGALVTGGGVLGRGGLLGRVGPRVGWGERDAVGVGKGVGFGLDRPDPVLKRGQCAASRLELRRIDIMADRA